MLNGPDHPSPSLLAAGSLLRGILFDDRGHAMRAVHSNHRGRRYRYYVSAAALRNEGRVAGTLPRIGVGVIDTFVLDHVGPALSQNWLPGETTENRTRSALVRVTVSEKHVAIFCVWRATTPIGT